ncbi:hypothetical protein [Catenuloplanes japonicus]|uniref:hypothetical protein n=1 Tax=Catenuloplanes japonicus TaxID=33876 RepID=UPI00068E27F5|nr:hypothetical protein [Catenuloplanes japonicus]
MGSHNWDGPGMPEGAQPSPSPDRPPADSPGSGGSAASGASGTSGDWPEHDEPTKENRPRRRGPFPPRIAPRFGGTPPASVPPPPPTGSPIAGPPPISGAGPHLGHGHGHSHGSDGLPRAFLVLVALVAVILLGLCAAAVLISGTDAPEPTAAAPTGGRVEGGNDGGVMAERPSLDDIEAAGVTLREQSYQVSFLFRRSTSLLRASEPTPVPVKTLTWTGDLRSTGGEGASWDIRSQINGQATGGGDLGVVDTLSVVETGDVRYLDSDGRTFGDRPWIAVTGPDRGTFCWPAPEYRSAAGNDLPIPLPITDPVEYLDFTSAQVSEEKLQAGATRYTLSGGSLAAGERLTAALRSLATATGVETPEYTIAVTLAGDRTLTAVELTGTGASQGITLTMAPHSPGVPVTVTAPPADQVSR